MLGNDYRNLNEGFSMSDPTYHYRRKLEGIAEGCSTNQVIAMTMACQQIAVAPLETFDVPFSIHVQVTPVNPEESNYGREHPAKPTGS